MSDKVSILIVNFNRLEYLKGTMEALFDTVAHEHEILIWDNASTEEGMREYLESLNVKEDVRVFFHDENIGVWRASNKLIAEANEPERLGFVKLDNDVMFRTTGWLTRWIDCCELNPEVGMLAVNIEGKKERSPDTEVLELHGEHPVLSLIHEGTGGAVYIPGETFKNLGYYNEEYGRYGQADKDYARRVLVWGKKFCYHRDVEVERFAVNNDDQTGGYRDHKNLYVRRNRKLYVLNRHLYQRRLRSLGIWYERYPVPEETKNQPGFVWSSMSKKVRWESGKVVKSVQMQLERHKLTKVKK